MIVYYTRRMKGKPTRGWGRLQTLHDLTKGDNYATFQEESEERKGWKYSGMMSEAYSTTEN